MKKRDDSNNFIISWEARIIALIYITILRLFSQAPPFNALAPPVIDYTININGDDKGTSDSPLFEYSGDIISGLYDISVSTNNDVGQSEPAIVENIRKPLYVHGYVILHYYVGVSEDIFNIEVVSTTSSSITLVCNSNISDVAVRCDVTLTGPSYNITMTNQVINDNIVFESLSPGTTYTYMATLTGVQNVCYQIESTVTTNGTAIPVTTTMSK